MGIGDFGLEIVLGYFCSVMVSVTTVELLGVRASPSTYTITKEPP
jgi:hypothetical protein